MHQFHYRRNLPTLRHQTSNISIISHVIRNSDRLNQPDLSFAIFSVVTECEKRIGAASSGHCSGMDPTVPPSGKRGFPLSARWRNHSEAGEAREQKGESAWLKSGRKTRCSYFQGGHWKSLATMNLFTGGWILNSSMEGWVALSLFTGLWLAYCESESETIIRAKYVLRKYVSCFTVNR